MKKILTLALFALVIAALTGCAPEYEKVLRACEEELPAYAEEMNPIFEAFWDELAIATSTARIALAEPVRELQSLRREAMNVDPPECMKVRHDKFIEGSGTMVQMMLDFMADPDIEYDDLDILVAQGQVISLGADLERYNEDPETFFEDLREQYESESENEGDVDTELE